MKKRTLDKSHLHIFSHRAYVDAFRGAATDRGMSIKELFECLVEKHFSDKDIKLAAHIKEKRKNTVL